jgi:tripartite-type tricarboxylate transporter receptor subunit TctC
MGALMRYASAIALGVAAAAAQAQDPWPAKPVRFIVPSSPGGGTDVFARLLAQALGETFKQQFVVDNRPGASGTIGAQAVAKAPPDGYTFLVSANAAIAIYPALDKSAPFDVDRDFAPVTRGVMAPMVVVTYAGSGIASLADLIAAGKSKPGTLAYGSAGGGTPPYLGVRMMEEASGARFIHVPYKGVGPAYQDLLTGRLAFMFTDLATAQPHLKSGKMVALAVNERTKLLPGVPSLADAGLAGVDVWTSFSVLAPAGTPPAILQRLGAEIAAAMKSPAFAERLEAQALVPVFDTPASFAANLKKEREHWTAFIQRNGITADQ